MGLDMYAVRKFDFPLDKQPTGQRYVGNVEDDGQSTLKTATVSISGTEESVMDWRKANHIHAWFVDNVQDGQDNCEEYPVSWEKLWELLTACVKVLKASELVDGAVYAGTVYDDKHPNGEAQREPGKVLKDDTVAKELLPTRSGFFFGCDEYDEDYLDGVKETHDWIVRMLVDHKNGVPGEIYYQSSW